MAKQALTWAHPVPASRQRNEKVVRLLRDEDAGWGVTESQAAFVYPHSLRPLRKIAGLETGSSDGNGTRVSELLEEAFPREQAEEQKDEASECKDFTTDGAPKDRRESDRRGDSRVSKGRNAGPRDSKVVEAGSGKAREDGNDRPHTASKTASGGKRAARGGGGGSDKTRLSGRPAFYPYGNGNTAPPVGGVVYGGYMLSHSINPQVLPNRPRRRQVHPETERVAVRAASKARAAAAASSTRRKARRRPAEPRSSSWLSRGARGEAWLDRGAIDQEQPSDDWCWVTTQAPIASFSAVPKHTGSCARRRNRPRVVTPGEPSSVRDEPRENRRERAHLRGADVIDSAGLSNQDGPAAAADSARDECQPLVDPKPSSPSPSRSSGKVDNQREDQRAGLQRSRQHSISPQAWTVHKGLANDPRNYKFLPRGWEQELITPAGIAGSISSPGEALLLREGGGQYMIRDSDVVRVAPLHVDDAGVRGCLKWNPGH